MKEVYEVTGSNQEAFDENLKESQEITRTNVESTIASLKKNKSATTKENTELLEAFLFPMWALLHQTAPHICRRFLPPRYQAVH
mgnify:CR=1 FL=1